MPLKKSDSKEAMSFNYKKLKEEGKKKKQRIAIMLSLAGKSNKGTK